MKKTVQDKMEIFREAHSEPQEKPRNLADDHSVTLANPIGNIKDLCRQAAHSATQRDSLLTMFSKGFTKWTAGLDLVKKIVDLIAQCEPPFLTIVVEGWHRFKRP